MEVWKQRNAAEVRFPARRKPLRVLVLLRFDAPRRMRHRNRKAAGAAECKSLQARIAPVRQC